MAGFEPGSEMLPVPWLEGGEEVVDVMKVVGVYEEEEEDEFS